MKTITNIFVALGVTLFLFIVGVKSEAEAQCDSNWTNLKDTVTVDGCQYEVDLCFLCRLAYPGQIKLNSYRNIGPCTTTLDLGQIGQGIIAQISTWGTVFFDYCQQRDLPPCDEGVLEFSYILPICWRAKLDVMVPPPGKNIYSYEPCGGASCEFSFNYCEGLLGPLKTIIGDPIILDGPITCELEGYQILPLPNDFVGQVSACYFLHTPCNP